MELSGYATKTNRRKLTGAYSDKSPLRAVFHLTEEEQIALYATDGRCLIFSTAQLAVKTTRATQGVAVMSLKKKPCLNVQRGSQSPASKTRPATAPVPFRRGRAAPRGRSGRETDDIGALITSEVFA